MRLVKIVSPALITIILISSFSCNNVEKKIGNFLAEEATEKLAKEVVSESGEKSIKSLTKKEIREIDWEDLFKMIRKENINLFDALDRLDGSFKKDIVRAMQYDREFCNSLISNPILVDEFSVFAKSSAKASENLNLFRYYAKARNLELRFGSPQGLKNIIIKEELGSIVFMQKETNRILGELKDGIMTLKNVSPNGVFRLGDDSFIKNTLIPNILYKYKGKNGLEYMYKIDDLGRISKIDANKVNINELLTNVVYAKENFNLGAYWSSQLKRVSQTSKGNDIDATLIFKYAEDETAPLAVKAEIKAQEKKIISESFENIERVSKKVFTSTENAAILNKTAAKVGLTPQKQAKLFEEMGNDDGLAALIHTNPEFNIGRWIKTRNHVDEKLLARDGKGYVTNGRVYAGNVYYFNPHLNSGLNARVKSGQSQFSYIELVELDKLYPDGVPFTKQGYPDFTKVAFKIKEGKPLKVNINQLSGDSKTDIRRATEIACKMGYETPRGYTWHHIENSTELILVPRTIHELVRHSGGMSTHAAKVKVQPMKKVVGQAA